jgi:adenine/guanine/hypoxanthine permease
MKNIDRSDSAENTRRPPFHIELLAGLSTFLTMSYVFVLNPILLAKTGIDVGSAFIGTILSAAIATFLMGWYANVPFAVAPAPSITSFFVSYVCLTLGLTWQQALAAVVISGGVSWLMAKLSIRQKLVSSIGPSLGLAVLCAVGGFLVANGLKQAELISFKGGWLDIASLSQKLPDLLWSPNACVFYTGLTLVLFFSRKWVRLAGGAPLVGIIGASIVAAIYGIKSSSPVEIKNAGDAMLKTDFVGLFTRPQFLLVILVFFIIDFFGGIGKYIGLFKAMGDDMHEIPEKNLERAMEVDGLGTRREEGRGEPHMLWPCVCCSVF